MPGDPVYFFYKRKFFVEPPGCDALPAPKAGGAAIGIWMLQQEIPENAYTSYYLTVLKNNRK
jgi:hypothetical protein